VRRGHERGADGRRTTADPHAHRGRSTDRRRRLAWRPCPGAYL